MLVPFGEYIKNIFIPLLLIYVFRRSYCYTVWSAIGIIMLSVRPSVCDAVHCGMQYDRLSQQQLSFLLTLRPLSLLQNKHASKADFRLKL